MEYVRLHGLRPQAYEHPSDTKTLDILQGTSGLETLIRKCNEFGLDRLLRVQLMGSYLRASADCFPQLYSAVQEGCEILDVPKRPASTSSRVVSMRSRPAWNSRSSCSMRA